MVGPDDKRERCSCYKQLILESWRSQSGIPAANASFDNFNLELYSDRIDRDRYGIDISPRENANKNLNYCKKFTANFSQDSKDLLFTGQAGLGKTFLCGCISKELIEKDVNVMYTTAYKLFSIILNFDQEDRSRNKSFEELVRTTPVLIIDDLGAENQSDAKRALLIDILNDRESNNDFYPCKTIISTNLSPTDINEYYGERICSRIVGRFRILQFAGDDIRLQRSRK